MEGIRYTGIPSAEELAGCPGVPSQERMRRGRVACIECVQEIPCNPCQMICSFGAITVGDPITNLPHLDEDKCTGCGMCVANCPGLAITLIDKSLPGGEATVDFPFEYLPLPAVGDQVAAVGRDGQSVCTGRVLRVTRTKAYAGTTVIRMAVPVEYADQVRSMQRLRREEPVREGERDG